MLCFPAKALLMLLNLLLQHLLSSTASRATITALAFPKLKSLPAATVQAVFRDNDNKNKLNTITADMTKPPYQTRYGGFCMMTYADFYIAYKVLIYAGAKNNVGSIIPVMPRFICDIKFYIAT